MAGTKKSSKKTSRSASRSTASAATQKLSPAMQQMLEQARADAYRQGVVETRANVDNFLHGLNDANAFSVLERLRAEFTRIDQAGGGIAPGSVEFVIEGKGDAWSWRAIASNGEVMADSADDVYTRQEDALRGAQRFIDLVKARSSIKQGTTLPVETV